MPSPYRAVVMAKNVREGLIVLDHHRYRTNIFIQSAAFLQQVQQGYPVDYHHPSLSASRHSSVGCLN